MKTSNTPLFASLVLASFLCSVDAAQAMGSDDIFSSAEMFSRTFQAASSSTDPKGQVITTKRSSDGHGHMRVETQIGERDSVFLYNQSDQSGLHLMPAKKFAFKVKVPNMGQTPEKTNKKDLGAKTIDGHPCHGESFDMDNAHLELWIGDDIHYPVHTVMQTSAGTYTTQLTSFSETAPAAEDMQVPADYKVIGPGMQ